MIGLLYIFLIFSTVSQASSIIHQSMDYVDPESKAVALHAVSGIRNAERGKLATSYWNYLTAEEGDSDIYDLITSKTVQEGNKHFGLLGEDVKEVQDFLLKCKMFNNTETFASSVLPNWLKQVYENRQNDLYSKMDTLLSEIDFNDPTLQFLKKNNIHLGMLSYVIQNYYEKTFGHKKYLYSKNPLSLKDTADELEDLKAIIITEIPYYIHAKDVTDDQNKNLQYTHIVLNSEDFDHYDNSKIKDKLQRYLSDNSEGVVILAFNDSDNFIRNNYTIGRDIKCKKLVITGKSLRKIGNRFLNNCGLGIKELELPDELEEVGDTFLSDSKSLEKLEIKRLKKAGNGFLGGCSNFKKLEFSDNLEEVGDFFLFHASLEKLKIKGLKKAGSYFLCACTSLKELELSDELEEVGDNFLEYCESLEKLIMTQVLYKKLKKEGRLSYIPKSTKIIFKDSVMNLCLSCCVIQ